jgi:hypothetical protein
LKIHGLIETFSFGLEASKLLFKTQKPIYFLAKGPFTLSKFAAKTPVKMAEKAASAALADLSDSAQIGFLVFIFVQQPR